MSKTVEEVRAELDSKIPRDAIEQRDSGMGRKLSYLAGWYVIDRLNQVFGADRWSYRICDLVKTYEGQVKDKFYTSYTCTVALTTRYPDGTNRTDIDVGFGDGTDASNPGKTHELATKEAVTDALKRCAKSLGMSMGLGLYGKTQEFVEDSPPAPKPQVTPKAAEAPKAAAATSGFTTVEAPAPGKPAVGSATLNKDATAFKKIIINAAAVLEAKNIIDKGKFKQKHIIDGFGVDTINKLTDAQIMTLYTSIKTTYGKELNLQ